jgi:hypothetical protein
MERHENKEFGKDRDEIFSKAVRAGKRTYFFDVKSTRKNDYYLTITESKKRFEDDGGHSYEKHKLFLYKEDFEKFSEGLQDVFNYIKNNLDVEMLDNDAPNQPTNKEYTDLEFDDLDR